MVVKSKKMEGNFFHL